jgi:hypothetical protein
MSDITELFARDPLQLTDQDLDLIIGKLRELRQQYVQNPKPTTAAKQPKAKAASLEDLGL